MNIWPQLKALPFGVRWSSALYGKPDGLETADEKSSPMQNARFLGNRGFTLVELIYVMIIVTVLAGVALPLLDVSRFRLNSAVVETATELMAAQRSAVLRGHDVIVAIDQSGYRMRIHLDANNDRLIQPTETWKVMELGDGVTFARTGAPNLTASTSHVTFTQKQGEYPAVTFHRNGGASEQGIIYLNARGGGAQGENQRAVEVVRSTSKIKCWSYSTGIWMETC